MLTLILISALGAPTPPPRAMARQPKTEAEFVGAWIVRQGDTSIVWVFSRDGAWQSRDLRGRKVDEGEWWLQRVGSSKNKQLRIRHGPTLITHWVGSGTYESQDLVLGDTTDEIPLEFVRYGYGKR